MIVERDTVVYLNYRLANAAGEVIEDEWDSEPIAVLQGRGNIIVGLDNALKGHGEGDEFDVLVQAAEAYGDYKEGQTQRVPKKYFANAKRLRPGMLTQLRTEEGVRTVTVLKVGGKVIDVDTNHPLAGQDLNFKVRIARVREATAQEKAHRHAHADGHDH